MVICVKWIPHLLDSITYAGVLDDFSHGRWADEMGEKFQAMLREAKLFEFDYHRAYDPHGQHSDYQGMLSALRRVKYVMRGDDGKDYPLTGVEVRGPTDLEAQAYALMRQFVQGAPSPRHTKARPQTTKRRDKPRGGARFENDFSLAVIPQRKGEPLRLNIEPELQSLVKRIIAAGGNIPRTKLRQGKTDTFQPEKLLRSQTAQALVKAGLLGSQRNGRTTVFWAKSQAD